MNKRLNSFKNALRGIFIVFLKESNFKIQMTLAAMAILLGLYFNLSRIQWVLLTLCISMVFFAEIVNTIIERFADIIQPEKDMRIRDIKDMSAGAVLILSIGAFCVGLFIFTNKLLYVFYTTGL